MNDGIRFNRCIVGSLAVLALKALPVVILGGFTSVPGAIVGGLIIGVGEKIAEVYWGPLVGGAIENWFAYVLAALNGREEALRLILELGVDLNRPSRDLYSHGTPLHHAVWSGSLEAVKMIPIHTNTGNHRLRHRQSLATTNQINVPLVVATPIGRAPCLAIAASLFEPGGWRRAVLKALEDHIRDEVHPVHRDRRLELVGAGKILLEEFTLKPGGERRVGGGDVALLT